MLHIVDISVDNHWQHYEVIEKELSKYKQDLADRVKIIVVNKIDLVDPEMTSEIIHSFQEHGLKTVAVSAATGEGIELLKYELSETLDKIITTDVTNKESLTGD